MGGGAGCRQAVWLAMTLEVMDAKTAVSSRLTPSEITASNECTRH